MTKRERARSKKPRRDKYVDENNIPYCCQANITEIVLVLTLFLK